MTSLMFALASFAILGILVTVASRRHERRMLACLTAMGILCLYLFIAVLLGGSHA